MTLNKIHMALGKIIFLKVNVEYLKKSKNFGNVSLCTSVNISCETLGLS